MSLVRSHYKLKSLLSVGAMALHLRRLSIPDKVHQTLLLSTISTQLFRKQTVHGLQFRLEISLSHLQNVELLTLQTETHV